MGFEIQYEVIKKEGSRIKIEAKCKNGQWKNIETFLEEDVPESLHELIRKHVVSTTRYFDHRVKAFLRNIVLHPTNPMNVKYYQYKVEFQNRGALHIHGVIWSDIKKIERLPGMQGIAAAFSKLRIGEDLSKKEREALKSFVDMFITVSTHKSIVGEDVANIALEVQRHRCTACCRKYTDECRFHYPKLPSPETIIAKPLKDTGSERKKKVEKFNETIEKVKEIIRDEETVFNIMKKYDKQAEVPGEDYEINRKKRIQEILKLANVSMKDYLEALGYSKQGCTIVLERDLDEILVNPYNTEWLRAHNGNMDLQVCLDFFSVVTYITDYLCKSDDQLCDSIKSIMKNAKDQSLQERMKTLANAFVTHRSMGEAEAIVKIIPSLNLANSNVTCQWVNIDYESEKSTRWRKATQKEMESGIPVVQLENHEGHWYEQQDFYKSLL